MQCVKIRYVACKACGTFMITTAVCGVCKGTSQAACVLKGALLRMYVFTIEPSNPKRILPHQQTHVSLIKFQYQSNVI
jgi:hypothetical protein